MGYESRLYIVQKGHKTIEFNGKVVDRGEMFGEKKLYFAEIIATFNMCKCYPVSDIMRNYPHTDSYIIENDEEITKDCYDKALTEIPIEKAIKIIENAMKDDDYRRYAPCLAFLKTMYDNKNNWGDIVVLHYGY